MVEQLQRGSTASQTAIKLSINLWYLKVIHTVLTER